MRLLRPIGEDEMVTTFLRAELGSERYGAKLRELLARDGRDETVLRDPGLASIGDNEYRLGLLEEHRAYGRREGLFLGFPSLVEWRRARARAGGGARDPIHQLGLVADGKRRDTLGAGGRAAHPGR